MLGLAGSLVVAGRAPELPRDPNRNLLLVTIDTLRCDALGAYGNRQGTSPRARPAPAPGGGVGGLAPFFASADASLDVPVTSSAAQARLGRFDRARAGFERALALDPSNAMAHVQLATLLLGQGQLDEARRCLRTAIELDDRLALAHHTLGLVALTTGDPAGAEQCFRRAVELSPREADPLLQLGRQREARPYLERFLENAPRPLCDAQVARVRAWLARPSIPRSAEATPDLAPPGRR